MTTTCEVETKVLERKISELLGALTGRGGDLANALRIEAAQAAWKIAESLGPLTLNAANRNLQFQISDAFTISPKPGYGNLDGTSHSLGSAGFTWLMATPSFLVGIGSEKNQIANENVSDGLKMLRESKDVKSVGFSGGSRWFDHGKRGKQIVYEIDRYRITKSLREKIRAAISSRIGQSRAAFARVTVEILPNKRIPAFVRKQIPSVKNNGKSIFNDQTGQTSPFIEFGSRAKGVTSNVWINGKIIRGFKNAQENLTAKIRKIVAGQTYNWNTGAVFRPTRFEDN